MAEKKEISASVKDKYKMAGNFAPGKYHFKGAEIDTANTDIETLDKAVSEGFDVVVEIKATKATNK
jgi:hypothetical protein